MISPEEVSRITHEGALAQLFRLEASDIEGPRERTCFCRRDDIDAALDELRADGYAFVTIEDWDGFATRAHWSWFQKVTL